MKKDDNIEPNNGLEGVPVKVEDMGELPPPIVENQIAVITGHILRNDSNGGGSSTPPSDPAPAPSEPSAPSEPGPSSGGTIFPGGNNINQPDIAAEDPMQTTSHLRETSDGLPTAAHAIQPVVEEMPTVTAPIAPEHPITEIDAGSVHPHIDISTIHDNTPALPNSDHDNASPPIDDGGGQKLWTDHHISTEHNHGTGHSM